MILFMQSTKMNKLCKAEEHANHLIEAAERQPEKLLDLSTTGTKWKSIQQRLVDLYIEESKKQPKCKKLKCTSHLLAKLVQREKLNTLVVNLYPGNEGYTLMLRGRNGCDAETIRLPYEETELLEYIDNEELPPVLIDLLDKAQANIFYSGCVIVELKDLRRSADSTVDTTYVLLKPTPHTMLCDINAMTNDGHRWTQEDKFNLESLLLVHTNEPLCLDPSPAVFYVTNKLSYGKLKFNAHIIKKAVKKFSQASVNRKRKLAQCPAPKHLRLYDFITRKRDKVKPTLPVNLKVGKTCVDMWRQRDVELDLPEGVEVDKYAKCIEKPRETQDNTPVVVEEYTLETERSQGKVYLTKLTIQQRLTDGFYLGELYVDRDYHPDKINGSICRFPLGTRRNVDRYIKQFTEIFTEEGRRSVKIQHQVPGQAPTVTFTQSMPPFTGTQNTSAGTTTTTTVSSASSSTSTSSSSSTGGASSTANSAQLLISQAQQLAVSITGQSPPSATGDSTAASQQQLQLQQLQQQQQQQHQQQQQQSQQPLKLSVQINPSSPLLSPQGSQSPSGLTPTGLNQQQLALQQQQQQLLVARARQLQAGVLSLQRSSGSPLASPSTPPAQATLLPTYTQAVAPASGASDVILAPTSLATLNPSMSPPSPTGGSLLQASVSALSSRQTLSLTQGGSNPATPTTPGLPTDNLITDLPSQTVASLNLTPGPNPSTGGTANVVPNQNTGNVTLSANQATGLQLASLAGLQGSINVQGNLNVQGNINVQGLTSIPGVNLTSIPGLHSLHNVQVTLSSVTVPSGVIPLSVINSGGGATGILVSSIQGTQPASSSAATPERTPSVTSPQSYVTMVTLPMTTSPIGTTTTTTAPLSSGSVTMPSSVLTSPNMLQLPIGYLNLKNQAGTVRTGTPLSLLQLPGQPPVQLLSSLTPAARTQLTLQAHAQAQAQAQANKQQSSSPLSQSTMLSDQQLTTQSLTETLTAQPITTQAVMSLPQLATSQATVSRTAQAPVILTQQQIAAMSPAQQQTLAAQLALQKNIQLQQKTIQLQQKTIQLQQLHQQQQQHSSSKSRSRKRSTPPKSS